MSLSLARRVGGAVVRRAGALVAPNFFYAETVVQLFLHGPMKRTTYTFTNVASLYAPQDAVGCRYRLVLYGASGERIGATEVEVPKFGTAEVRLEDRLPGPLPDLGILVAQVRSSPRLHRSDVRRSKAAAKRSRK